MEEVVAGQGKSWRDSAWFASIEFVLFAAVFIAGTYNYLPISHTPYLFVLAWLMLFVRAKGWADVGFRDPDHFAWSIWLGAAAGVALSLNELILLEPFVRSLSGSSPDLSQFKHLNGNLPATLFYIALSWVLAAFGEEMVFRGYAMTRVAQVMGDTASAWLVSIVVVNIAFGTAHDYQDLSGMIVTGIGGVAFGVLYLLSGKNLLVPIVAHGTGNTCDFLFMYYGGIIPGI